MGVLLRTIYNILYSKDQELPLVCLLGSIAAIIVVVYLNQDTFVELRDYTCIYAIIVKQYLGGIVRSMATSSRGAPHNPPTGQGSSPGGGGRPPPQDPHDPYKGAGHYRDEDDDGQPVLDQAKRMRIDLNKKKRLLRKEKNPNKLGQREQSVREAEARITRFQNANSDAIDAAHTDNRIEGARRRREEEAARAQEAARAREEEAARAQEAETKRKMSIKDFFNNSEDS